MNDLREPEPCEVSWETTDEKGKKTIHYCSHSDEKHPGKHTCSSCSSTY